MKITIEELNILLQREFKRGKSFNNCSIEEQLAFCNKLSDYWNETPEQCKSCPNHPSNGGSGICNCMLGDTITTTYSTNTKKKD